MKKALLFLAERVLVFAADRLAVKPKDALQEQRKFLDFLLNLIKRPS